MQKITVIGDMEVARVEARIMEKFRSMTGGLLAQELPATAGKAQVEVEKTLQ